MNQKIKFIRENLNLTNKDISVFLNISSYKYAAFEQIGMDIPCEFILLLTKLYNIKAEMIFENKYTNQDLLNEIENNNFFNISKEDLNKTLKYNLLGYSDRSISYRSIRKVKDIIQDNIIKKILSIMKEKNFSKHDFAVILEIDDEMLNSVLLKKRFISTDELVIFSQKFNIPISEMVK